MSSEADPLAWIERAEEDYALMTFSMEQINPLTYGACFHAQQCAEKYLKAMLVVRGFAFSRIHDLVALSNECRQAGIAMTVTEDQLSTLSFYAVRVRYPGETPTLEEVQEAVDIATVVRQSAREYLSIK